MQISRNLTKFTEIVQSEMVRERKKNLHANYCEKYVWIETRETTVERLQFFKLISFTLWDIRNNSLHFTKCHCMSRDFISILHHFSQNRIWTSEQRKYIKYYDLFIKHLAMITYLFNKQQQRSTKTRYVVAFELTFTLIVFGNHYVFYWFKSITFGWGKNRELTVLNLLLWA